jgi:hypothetical protein
MENRSEARRENANRTSSTSRLIPLTNKNGELPNNFPDTLGLFWNMNAATANNLIAFYQIADLPAHTTLDQKRRRLALYCAIQLATHE